MADPKGPHPACDFRQVTDWVFDLDNTLYPASHVFPEIDRRMTVFVAKYLRISEREALVLQKRYYAEHGTTLRGMMERHAMPPAAFLFHVHEVDLSPVPRCVHLRAGLAALPGRKFIHTNGSRRHAERMAAHLGIDHLFDGMSGIEDGRYHPKPDPVSYEIFCESHGLEPARAAFFEDVSRNLRPARAMGFTTILVQQPGDWSHEPEPARPAKPGDDPDAHVDYVTADLSAFLADIAPSKKPPETMP